MQMKTVGGKRLDTVACARFVKMCKDSFYKLLFKCDLAVGCSFRDIISSLYMPNLNTLLCLCSIFLPIFFLLPAGHVDIVCGNSAQDAYFQPRQFAESVHMTMEDMFDDQLLMNMIPTENFGPSATVCAPAPAQWPHGYYPSCTDYYTNSLVCIISTPASQNHVSFKFMLPLFDPFKTAWMIYIPIYILVNDSMN